MEQQISEGAIQLSIKNIGGISESKTQLSPGVNILSGPNATNRTSFLRALAAAQGSKDVSIKADKSEATVELELGGEQFKRTVYDRNGTNVFEGAYPVDDAHIELAERFAFFFENNRGRRAIRQGDDLWDVVMEPVDTEEIEQQIKRLQEKRVNKEEEVSRIRALQDDLPQLKQRRVELNDEISDLTEDLEEKKAEVEETESNLTETKRESQELEEKVSTLRETQSELSSVRSRIESKEETIDQLEQDLEATEGELEEVTAVDSDELSAIDSELNQLHDDLARKETMMSELQNVIQFNKDMLGDDLEEDDPLAVLSSDQRSGASEGTPTDELVDTDEIVCWTCGTATSRTEIASTVERLQTVHEDIYGEREHLRAQIEECKERKQELETTEKQRAKLEDRRSDIESRLERTKETLETLEEKEEDLATKTGQLEDEIAALREEHEDEILELRQEMQNIEIDLQQAKDEHESVKEEINLVEEEVGKIDSLEETIDEITADIKRLRGRVNRIEAEIVEQFNENMDTVLEVLEYGNIERIWIERREVTVKEGRKNVDKTKFDLHVVREAEDGGTYEDTIAHLSESEREVTGLIFTLAGYLAFEVYEKVPFMILDSLEAIDSNRIALLIEFLQTHADNIAIALLEEDAAALDSSYRRITDV